MAEQEAHIVPHPSGAWEVVVSGREGGSIHQTQRDALHRAREIARLGGGEVVVHARDGRIRESETIAPEGHLAAP